MAGTSNYAFPSKTPRIVGGMGAASEVTVKSIDTGEVLRTEPAQPGIRPGSTLAAVGRHKLRSRSELSVYALHEGRRLG